ncbi:hypothetical protein GCM10007063_05890 [Lentibacillus kapialis]|uniref:YqaJ viral recombinase domain-containing protein n=1 Tax=Lentibacillus kapialis TaxID=340214 RepID=A0A917UUL1_9BACI|nr:YqaJ viral recombinase family protein [Lentibacillus kapialis]GGJ86201.1 hypothetical protein GCM10007063_05890 [Lentibacillus kapialis]
MITSTNDRYKYIGGSEANMIYQNYESKTFVNWWAKKLSELPGDEFTNKSMSVGTILEHDILDLYESVYHVQGEREAQKIKGIARANTDYILGDKVSDVKATYKAFEWFLKEKVPIHYKRQLIHYVYVFELNKASIIAYQVDDETADYPFNDLDPDKLFEIDVPITKKEVTEHKQRLDYMEHCREMNIFPRGL